MYDNLRPSYEEIHNACKDISLLIDPVQLGITQVVGVARGGLLPAVILSHMLKLPLLVVDYSSKHGNGDDKNHNNALPRIDPHRGGILLVDDICDSGQTLNELALHFVECNVAVYTAVLYHKTHDKQPMTPDFTWKTIPHDAGWVIFPYERDEYLSPDFNGPTRFLQSLVRS